MKIQNGEEFLEKLGNLDPDLVAEADRPPERASRTVRGWGPGISTWIAVAACLCVLCLPMILRAAFPPPLESGGIEGTAGGAATSHQLEAAQAEGGADAGGTEAYTETERATEKSAEDMQEDFTAGTTFYHPGPDGWEMAVFHQEYVDSLPGGLPAKYYFINNNQAAGEKELWDDAYESDFGVEYSYDTVEDLLPPIEGYGATHVFPEFEDENQLPSRLSFQWDKDGEAIVTGYITVNVVEQEKEILPKDQENLRAYMKKYGQTIVERNGLEVTALGGPDTDKTLSFWQNGYFYRIYGAKDADMEAMVQLLDWLLVGDFQLADYSRDRAVAKGRLQDYPDAFAGYYPTDSRWVPKAAAGILEMEGDTPVSLGLDYRANGGEQLVTYWIVGTAEYAAVELQYEALSKPLAELSQEDVTAYFQEMQEKGKEYVSFWWNEEVKAVFWYREGATAEEIWELVQYLQSDEVKIERKIGEIVELRPYAQE